MLSARRFLEVIPLNNEKLFSEGLVKYNPLLTVMLGITPALAVTSETRTALLYGAAAAAAAVPSAITVSLLKRMIPRNARIPAHALIVCTYCTLISLVMEAFLPGIWETLGRYMPLLAGNCMILGLSEIYAEKRTVIRTAAISAGQAAGYWGVLVIMGIIRELLGMGTIFGKQIIEGLSMTPAALFTAAPGGLFVLAMLAALRKKLLKPGERK